MNIECTNKNDILEFNGEYRWLSNFWPVQVTLDFVTYPSIENAYQASKAKPSERDKFITCTSGQSKRLGKSIKIRDDWDNIKVTVMNRLIEQKFAINTELGNMLINTGQ